SVVDNYTISDLVGEGGNLQTLGIGGDIELTFKGSIGEDTDACDIPMKNIAFDRARGVAEQQDEALTTVCQPEKPKVAVVKAVKTTPPETKLPETGAAGAAVAFSITSVLGFATYKLKELYAYFLR